MFTPNIYKAIVTDNNDLDQKGKIQIRVIPELEGVEIDLLPWVRPFMYQDMSHNPPEIDSLIWCFFIDEEFWKKGYWISEQFIDGFFDFAEAYGSIDFIAELSNQEYPFLHFKKLSDGTVFFHNTVTKDTGIYSPTNSYALLNYKGDIVLGTDTNKLSVTLDGTILTTQNSFSLSSEDKSDFFIFDTKLNTLSIQVIDAINIKSNSLLLTLSSLTSEIGKVDNTYTSLSESTIGTKKENIGGIKTFSVGGDYQKSIIGKTSETYLQDFESFYGTKFLTTATTNYTVKVGTNIAEMVIDAAQGVNINIVGMGTITIDPSGITIDAGTLPVNIKGSLINLG